MKAIANLELRSYRDEQIVQQAVGQLYDDHELDEQATVNHKNPQGSDLRI